MHRIAWFAVWWVVLFWLWLAFAGEWNRIEWIAAAIAATVAASIASIVCSRLRYRFRTGWLREAERIPWQLLVDCAVVLAAPARRREGVFHARPTGPKGASAEAAGRAAFLTLAATFSPNAYVVDADRETGTVLLHDLVPRRDSERPA